MLFRERASLYCHSHTKFTCSAGTWCTVFMTYHVTHNYHCVWKGQRDLDFTIVTTYNCHPMISLISHVKRTELWPEMIVKPTESHRTEMQPAVWLNCTSPLESVCVRVGNKSGHFVEKRYFWIVLSNQRWRGIYQCFMIRLILKVHFHL